MADLTGQAFVWGIPGLSGVLEDGAATSTATLAAISVFQSFDFSREAEISDLQDESGDTIGRAYFNKKQTARVTVVPANSGTISVANTNAALLLPTPGSKISSFADSDLSTITGSWAVLRSSFARTNTEKMAIDLELEKFEDNDITTSVT